MSWTGEDEIMVDSQGQGTIHQRHTISYGPYTFKDSYRQSVDFRLKRAAIGGGRGK